MAGEQGVSAMNHADCHHHPAATAETVKDPVCGMSVDPAKSPHHAVHDGQDYLFCSGGCRTKFVADPEGYLGGKPRPQPVAAPGAMWICPMDPEIRQDGPGPWPGSAVALGRVAPSRVAAPTPELIAVGRLLWVAGVLGVPSVMASMGAEMRGLYVVTPAAAPRVQPPLAAGIVVWAGGA